ncbi:MAG: RQC domain-containing protein [candidate division KSB1 bacterium]|nr:RQC domain-containing protein [candidate division KSB1 bacterium]MDZ7275405.1 RQC domain-containing protein [candidate division KSB1 bacterium]MDZ7286283.1 RQC domain-containing protein [candidate division KSB1 bacterium]MDZ7296509.1 RQC domain-containing protein [candidate division KSB1 bacterium]MDZ7305533.1 RQC domain-containing protein [candidate division KSB1 bacterium]
MNEKIRCIVATNAFGMGIDKSNVRFVLHTDMPGTLEACHREGGRAGRDDEPADCIIFYSPQDLFLQEFFIDNDNPEPEIVHEVYDVLRNAEVDVGHIIQWRSDEIARMLGENTTASLVNAALQFLTEIHCLTLITPPPDTFYFRLTTCKTTQHPEKPEAQTATMPLNFLQELAGDAPATWHRLDLREPVRLLHLSRSRLMQGLEALAAQNFLQIAGPFKHRGILLSDAKRPLRFDKNILIQRRIEATAKLRHMQRYCELASCRRHFILDSFGESHAATRCENCDNCGIVWQTSAEATLLAQKILSCVVRMQERFGAKAVAEVLKGSNTERSRNFAGLSTFALLRDLPLKQIEKDIQRLILRVTSHAATANIPCCKSRPKTGKSCADSARLHCQR